MHFRSVRFSNLLTIFPSVLANATCLSEIIGRIEREARRSDVVFSSIAPMTFVVCVVKFRFRLYRTIIYQLILVYYDYISDSTSCKLQLIDFSVLFYDFTSNRIIE